MNTAELRQLLAYLEDAHIQLSLMADAGTDTDYVDRLLNLAIKDLERALGVTA